MGLSKKSGQLPAVAAAIFSPTDGDDAVLGGGRYQGIFYNTSGSLTETITLTETIVGGGSRTIARFVLLPNEIAVMRGLAMSSGDILGGITSDATTVDYTISIGGVADFSITVYDSSGSVKSNSSNASGSFAIGSNLTFGGDLRGTGNETVAAAGANTGNATVLSASMLVHSITGSDGAKGVRINSSDDVKGTWIWVENHVAAVMKVYPPTGGQINAAGADVAFSTTSGKGGLFYCMAPGTWLAANLA